jgi:hypothetical protein
VQNVVKANLHWRCAPYPFWFPLLFRMLI